MRDGVRSELRPERREMLEQQRRQETIFSERQQILLVQGIDVWLGIFFDNAVGDDDGATFVVGTDAVHGETTGKTSDGTEEGFEGFGQVVGDVVLEHCKMRTSIHLSRRDECVYAP